MVASIIASALLAFGGCQRGGEAACLPCRARHRQAKGEQGKAKKKAVKPLATNRSIRRTGQPALAEGPPKVRRPMPAGLFGVLIAAMQAVSISLAVRLWQFTPPSGTM